MYCAKYIACRKKQLSSRFGGSHSLSADERREKLLSAAVQQQEQSQVAFIDIPDEVDDFSNDFGGMDGGIDMYDDVVLDENDDVDDGEDNDNNNVIPEEENDPDDENDHNEDESGGNMTYDEIFDLKSALENMDVGPSGDEESKQQYRMMPFDVDFPLVTIAVISCRMTD